MFTQKSLDVTFCVIYLSCCHKYWRVWLLWWLLEWQYVVSTREIEYCVN